MELQFLDYEFGTPKYTEEECRTKDLTFSKPLYVNVELLIKETGEIQRQRVYMGDYPWMTDLGTFVINGAERVVVCQLVRSPGVYYSDLEDPAVRAGCSSRPRSSRTAAPGSSSRRTTRTSSGSRSTASARSRRRRCSARSATRRTTRSPRCSRRSTSTRSTRTSPTRSTRTSPTPSRGPHRGLQEAAPGRPAHRRQRPPARREPLLQLPPLRPRPRRPLQVQQEARRVAAARMGIELAARAAGRSPARTSPRSSATSSSRTAASIPRTTSTTSATAASGPTAS